MAVTMEGKVNGVPCDARVFDNVIPIHEKRSPEHSAVRICFDNPSCPLEHAGLADGSECIVEVEGEIEFVGRCIIVHPEIQIAWVEGQMPAIEDLRPK